MLSVGLTPWWCLLTVHLISGGCCWFLWIESFEILTQWCLAGLNGRSCSYSFRKKKAQRGQIGCFRLYVYAMYYSMGIMNSLFICFWSSLRKMHWCCNLQLSIITGFTMYSLFLFKIQTYTRFNMAVWFKKNTNVNIYMYTLYHIYV